MTKYENINGALSDVKLAKRPYRSPTLLVFGQVASLTRSQSGCDTGDNTACTVFTGGTMGKK